MPAQPSNDFGARLLGDSGKLSIHNHLFLGANTALPFLRSDEATIAAHQNFLQDCVRVDLFGIKEGGTLSGKLHAPLRPEIPELVPGESYLLETVVRTLKIGHHFSQGTVDSNEIWVSVEVFSGNELIAQSGHVDESDLSMNTRTLSAIMWWIGTETRSAGETRRISIQPSMITRFPTGPHR